MEPNARINGFDIQTLRLIDANANRAREGIRTAEDYIRFIAGQGVWAAKLKRIRHGLTNALAGHFATRELVNSRNVVSDPLSPTSEDAPKQTPGSEKSRDVALRGLKRAQEALRVLEEFVRGHFSETSAVLAGYRYITYEAEQWLVCASPAMEVVSASSIYVLLTEKLCSRGLFETTREILKGGVRLLQIREKQMTDAVLFARVHDLLSITKEYGAVLICNDNLALAMATGCAGVHFGQGDLPPQAARRVSGERMLMGRSTHSKEQALKAVNEEGVDYVAIGSMYDTATKPERQLTGPALAEEVSALKLDVPVFAIGGITTERISELKQCGVKQFAVSSAIISSPDPRSAAQRMIEAAQR